MIYCKRWEAIDVACVLWGNRLYAAGGYQCMIIFDKDEIFIYEYN